MTVTYDIKTATLSGVIQSVRPLTTEKDTGITFELQSQLPGYQGAVQTETENLTAWGEIARQWEGVIQAGSRVLVTNAVPAWRMAPDREGHEVWRPYYKITRNTMITLMAGGNVRSIVTEDSEESLDRPATPRPPAVPAAPPAVRAPMPGRLATPPAAPRPATTTAPRPVTTPPAAPRPATTMPAMPGIRPVPSTPPTAAQPAQAFGAAIDTQSVIARMRGKLTPQSSEAPGAPAASDTPSF
jgi:hypothetical protein